MANIRNQIVLLTMAVIALSTSSHATNAEREALMVIAHEIDAMAPLVQAAEASAQPGERIQFRYDWLRRDLERVRQGVLEHANADQAEPRAVAPLRGDYRR